MFHFVSDYICSRAELETKRAKRGGKKERERGKVAKRTKNKKRKKGRREG